MTANSDKLDKTVTHLDAEALSLKSVSLWQITWRRLFKRKSAVLGMVILAILIFIALTAQWLAPYDPRLSMLDAKPPQALEKIIQGMLEKFYQSYCLVDQGFVKKNSEVSVKDHVAEVAKQLGDEITIRRFVRFQVGEAPTN